MKQNEYFSLPFGINPVLPVKFIKCGYVRRGENSFAVKENHPFYTIEYVLKGKGTLETGKRRYDFCPGDVFILHKRKNHYYHVHEPCIPWSRIWIAVDGSLIELLIQYFGLNDVYIIKAYRKPEIFFKIFKLAHSIEHQLDEKITSLVFEILAGLFCKINENRNSQYSQTISRLLSFIDGNLRNSITLKDICASAGKTSSYVTKVFKKETGMTPYGYYITKKLETARIMLLDSNLSIKEIARKLGFQYESHFSGIFTEKTGMSPVKFREQYKKE